jgi:hypothetical protein
MTDTTYRLITLGGSPLRQETGQTALTPALAKLVPGKLRKFRETFRLGIERTDWAEEDGIPRPVRTVLTEVESSPGEWKIGAWSDEPETVEAKEAVAIRRI